MGPKNRIHGRGARLERSRGFARLVAAAECYRQGQSYDLLLEDTTDKACGYAAVTDERRVIRQSKAMDLRDWSEVN